MSASLEGRAKSSKEALALVVQPDPDLREALVDALRVRMVGVLSTRGSKDAQAVLDRYPVEVMIVDAELPEMSGFDLAKSVRRTHGDRVAIIVLTDVVWTAAQKSAAIQQMGLLDLFVKPVEATEVAQRVVEVVGPVGAPGRSQDLWMDTLADRSAQIEETDTTTNPYGPRTNVTPADGLHLPDEPDTDLMELGALPAETEAGPSTELADKASRNEQQHVERATEAAQAGEVELRGNLTSTPFPRLQAQLYQRRATGALFLLSGRVKKIVYFKEGHPCYIKSNRLSECLGKVLVRERMITEAQCKESLHRMAESVRQQGTVLIEMDVITPHDLVVGLALQLRTKLMEIFTWTRGEYLFKSEAKVPAEVIRLDVSNATLIADGVRETWDTERLTEALGPHQERYFVNSPDPELRFQELSLEPEERELLDRADGTKTLRQLLADAPLPARKAMTVYYVLLVTGVMEASKQPLAQPVTAAPVVEIPPAEEANVRERLAGQLLFWQKQNAFGVLGVTAASSDEEVRMAFEGLAVEYHLDRFRHLSADTRRMAQDLFALINEAYQQIATDKQRRRYRKGISTKELRVGYAAGNDVLEAERLKRQALTLMESRSWHEARQILASAVDLCKEAGDLRALLGWSTFRSDPENAALKRAAINEVRQAIELDPGLDQAYLYLGRIYAGMGKTILAEKQFEKALQCNPDCSEALDELKIQKERRPPRRYRF
jgi:tetratricopeptide (TPR) repeat protein/ActR/RegA family two-component response regulator